MLIWRTPRYTGPERRQRPRWRPQPLRVLLILLCLAAAGYAVAVIWLVAQESRVVVQAGSAPATAGPPIPYEEIALRREDDAHQFAWVMRTADPDRAPWVLYLHGNASTVASGVNVSHYQLLTGLGLNVLAPEYRGFGGLDGVPTESSLQDDAHTAYQYLRATRGIEPSDLVLYGWSLGSALAVDLASRQPVRAVVLEAPAASLADLTAERYPFFPLRWLMRNRFDSASRIGRVSAPILFLHGPDDDVIPISAGQRLFEAAGGDKLFVEIGGGHFDAVDRDGERIALALREFLTRQGLALPASESVSSSSRSFSRSASRGFRLQAEVARRR